MLDEITVSNLGLIDEASLAIGPGLTVVSGETGTGKTLMLGALRLLRGDTAAKDLIGPHGDAADVSALFIVDGDEVVARRTVTPSRSKAYVDGHIVPAKTLAEQIGPQVAIVGQHDQHLITSSSGVRRLIDMTLDEAGVRAKDVYSERWAEYSELMRSLEELGGDTRTLARELETLRFQIAEIDEAGFQDGDEGDLRSLVAKLRSAAELEEDLDAAIGALGGDQLEESLSITIRAIERASRIDTRLEDRLTQANDIAALISDLSNDLVRYAADLASSDHDLDGTERRLAELAQLKRKYGDTIGDIITFRKNAEERATHLTRVLDQSADIDASVQQATAVLRESGEALLSARQDAAERLSETTMEHLRDLGFTNPLVEISVTAREPGSTGSDHTEILFSSDSALQPAPVASIASGGELSRLVLAMTVGAGGTDADVVAFDEIDAGVGGTTALAMGEKLAAMAHGRQVVCVTHLPQVAAYGDHHLVVSRDGTTTSVEPVTGEDRVTEITRMLAGLGESDTGREHARELLTRVGGS